MLELKELCFTINKDGEDINLVDHVSIEIPRGHFMAIVGPSGCGKTTLLKTIAGLNAESAGSLIWEDRNICEEGDFEPAEIGYVPQFSIAYDPLTVDESIEAATKLRVKTKNSAELDDRIDRAIEETGMQAIADRPVKVLSGGQKRRLGLAMELVSNPLLLLCDEVTSGLDPRSEREIVNLLHQLSHKDGRIVLSVTHSLADLELYDSVLILHEGCVAYHGPPSEMTHYFSVDDVENIYPKLAKQKSSRWQKSWNKHKGTYYQMLEENRAVKRPELYAKDQAKKLTESEKKPISEDEDSDDFEELDENKETETKTEVTKPASEHAVAKLPGFFSQFLTLLFRRWKIFFRDRGQVFLQLAILICFPIIVTLFSEKASGNIRRYSDIKQDNIFQEIQEAQSVRSDQAKVGSAISGIIMFQVVLLALMGSNNSAREIAGERLIYEKEKFGGLRPSAYLMSKIVFLSVLVIAQSLWMALFVEFFGPFRGNFEQHIVFLILINASMTAICLAISAMMKTAEQASLLSIYLVGFQLPLSGAVLALPEKIEAFTRPFISAYWSWSGSVDGLQSQVYTAINSVIDTSLSTKEASLYTLAIHITVALCIAWLGARKPQWD